jgi:hypothetical protein
LLSECPLGVVVAVPAQGGYQIGLKYNLRWIKCELADHFANADMDMLEYGIQMDIGYHRSISEPTIRPNASGIALLVLWEYLIYLPYIIIRMGLCNHPNFEDESYGGPESGCMAGHCPDCGWGYHETLY